MNEKYYYGQKISEYGIEEGFVDYETLSKVVGDAVSCDAMANRYGETLHEVSGNMFDEEGNFIDVFQWYIISDYGAEFLIDKTDEIVLYDKELKIYVWGITHYGTHWSNVLTNIKISEL